MTAHDSSTSRSTDVQAITLENFHIPIDRARTVNLSATVKDAACVMDDHNIDQVPVVDVDYGEPMVVTRRMIAAVDLTVRAKTPIQVVLKEHSNDPAQRLLSTTLLADAMEALIYYDWVLTTDEHGKPVGLATVGDALREVLERQHTRGNV